MKMSRPFALMTWTLAFSVVAGTAAAQSSAPQVSRRGGYYTFGGTIGTVLAETPGGIPDLAGHVEVPLATWWSVRGQIGRHRELTSVNRTTETLTLRRFTTSLVLFIPRGRDRGLNYIFAGVGAYQYRYGRSEANDNTQLNPHFGIGAESPAIGAVVLNAEVTLRRDLHPTHVSPLTMAAGLKIRY
jgi:hypothetical protein